MQAATMTREMVMTRTLDVDVEAARELGRRLAVWAIIGVGVVASGFADAAPSSVVETAEPHQR